jgi:hypothetical protein
MGPKIYDLATPINVFSYDNPIHLARTPKLKLKEVITRKRGDTEAGNGISLLQ